MTRPLRTATLFLCLTIVSLVWSADTVPVIPMQLHYERSGPGVEAALYAPDPDPDLAAAHRISLASNIPSTLSTQQLEQLRLYGPWLTVDGLSDNAQTLIRAIQEARIHGLDPEVYGLTKLLETIDALTALDRSPNIFPSQKPLPQFAAESPIQNGTTATELNLDKDNDTGQSGGSAGASQGALLTPVSPGLAPNLAISRIQSASDSTDATTPWNKLRSRLAEQLQSGFKDLISDLGQGVVNGRLVQPNLYRSAPRIDSDKYLQSVIDGRMSVAMALKRSIPTHKHYSLLTRVMRDLLTEIDSSVRRTQVAPVPVVEGVPDDQHLISQRLFEMGLLPLTEIFETTPASMTTALRQLQKQYGLEQTGNADRKTRSALNRSVEQDISDLALSLERWRWMPRDLGKRHILVNIPEYQVYVVEGSETLLSMTAVVGTEEHQTPSFSRDMTYMEFNPTWTVPASIANEKLIPLERDNPGYLKARHFHFLENRHGRFYKVPAQEVTQYDYQREPFPYTIRQSGGKFNALGKMKFMMPNPYAIYLHDTQYKQHFTLNDRAYSHGCIRLHRPAQLARLLMRKNGYDEQTIQNSLGSNETHRIRFKEPFTTHLAYYTAWIDENNQPQFRPDIYGHNQALALALKKKNSLLNTLDGSSL